MPKLLIEHEDNQYSLIDLDFLLISDCRGPEFNHDEEAINYFNAYAADFTDDEMKLVDEFTEMNKKYNELCKRKCKTQKHYKIFKLWKDILLKQLIGENLLHNLR